MIGADGVGLSGKRGMLTYPPFQVADMIEVVPVLLREVDPQVLPLLLNLSEPFVVLVPCIVDFLLGILKHLQEFGHGVLAHDQCFRIRSRPVP
jgi:hypothetical protein